MTENNESNAGSEESAAPASDGRAQLSDSRREITQGRRAEGPPRPSHHEPAPGLMHVFDESTGLWMVRRDPAYKGEGEESSSTQEQPAAKQDDADVNDTYKRGGDELVLPEHLPS